MRIVDGGVRVGDRIRMMSSGAEFDVTEVGYFRPGELVPVGELRAGEVGYKIGRAHV